MFEIEERTCDFLELLQQLLSPWKHSPHQQTILQYQQYLCDVDCQTRYLKKRLYSEYSRTHSEKLPPSGCYIKSSLKQQVYGNFRISRSEMPKGTKFVCLDLGGEGLSTHDNEVWGKKDSINVNCSYFKTLASLSAKPQPISNHIFGFSDYLPFSAHFADEILLENSPFNEKIAQEMERVIIPGGAISIRGPSDAYLPQIALLLSHFCIFPPVKFKDEFLSVYISVPKE